MSGLANWFCLLRIDMLDHLSGVLSEQVSPARITLTEAKTRVESFGLATYKMYASADADQAKETADSVKGEYVAANVSLGNLLNYFPKRAGDVARIRQKLELAHGIAMEVYQAIVANDRAKAQVLLDLRFDPARDDVSFQLNRLINVLGGEANDMLDQAAQAKAWIMKITVATLIGGSILIETVFAWPGTGFLLNSAIFRRDLPILQGTTLVLAFFFMMLNLVVDVIQTMVDPRIKRA